MKIDFKSLIRKLRILPILIIVASFGFVVRLGDTYVSLKSMSGSAYAEEAAKADEKTDEKAGEKLAEKPVEKADEEVAAEKENKSGIPESPVSEPPKDELKSSDTADEAGDAGKIDLPSTDAADEGEKSTGDKKWQDASDTESADSDIKKEVFQDLTKRRTELELKERKLGEREALLEAAQKELDKKVTEMEGLRDELRDLLKQQTAEEAARIQSLVKIYSGMKPKDAARIFNTLDTDILMDVIGNMPESKAGGIIALMDADRAKALTTLLAEQKKLPEVP